MQVKIPCGRTHVKTRKMLVGSELKVKWMAKTLTGLTGRLSVHEDPGHTAVITVYVDAKGFTDVILEREVLAEA